MAQGNKKRKKLKLTPSSCNRCPKFALSRSSSCCFCWRMQPTLASLSSAFAVAASSCCASAVSLSAGRCVCCVRLGLPAAASPGQKFLRHLPSAARPAVPAAVLLWQLSPSALSADWQKPHPGQQQPEGSTCLTASAKQRTPIYILNRYCSTSHVTKHRQYSLHPMAKKLFVHDPGRAGTVVYNIHCR